VSSILSISEISLQIHFNIFSSSNTKKGLDFFNRLSFLWARRVSENWSLGTVLYVSMWVLFCFVFTSNKGHWGLSRSQPVCRGFVFWEDKAVFSSESLQHSWIWHLLGIGRQGLRPHESGFTAEVEREDSGYNQKVQVSCSYLQDSSLLTPTLGFRTVTEIDSLTIK